MIRRDLTFAGSSGIRLAGTLTSPGRGTWPAALILNGSGPLDRDSAIKGQALGFAGPLATALAKAGVASLRFDKRGVGRSGGDFPSTGLDGETDDAAGALAAMRAAPEVDGHRLALVGHSVGALVSIRLAADDPSVGAAVLLAGPAVPGRRVLQWQTDRIAESLPGPSWLLPRLMRAQQAYGLRKLERSTGSTSRLLFKLQAAQWMREFLAYDPEPDLRRVRCPVLAITGRKDIQVDADDVERIGSLVAGPFTGETPPDLTHLLRLEQGPGGILSYRSQLRRPIDQGLLDRVSTWLAGQLDATGSTSTDP